MATTVAAVLVDGDVANLAHVGDSRVYLCSDGRAHASSRSDHSWVNEQIQSGVISADQARSHPLRNVVTRALGGKPDLQVDMQVARDGRRATCCSCARTASPPWSPTTRSRACCASAEGDVEKAAQALVDAANARGRRGQHHRRAAQVRGVTRALAPARASAPRVRASAATWSRAASARAAWAWSTAGSTRRSSARSRSRPSPSRAPSTRRAASASRSRPRPPPSCSTRTSSPSSSWARTAGSRTSRWSCCRAPTSRRCCARARTLLLAEKLDVVVQVCRGLAFAHEHGIVHRDIKPSQHPAARRRHRQDHGLRDRQARRAPASPRPA